MKVQMGILMWRTARTEQVLMLMVDSAAFLVAHIQDFNPKITVADDSLCF